MPHITLPDGSQRIFECPVTVLEVAESIGLSLAKAALAGRVDHDLVDLSYSIEKDAELCILTAEDPDGLAILRHSTAHLLAHAVKELFPQAQVTIGPVIENGFYYDFAYHRPFTPEDIHAIEQCMVQLVQRNEIIVYRVLARNAAITYFKNLGEDYKAQIIADIPEHEEIRLYRQGNFEDLCRGPHVPSTGHLKHFKLLKIAGAYWRGDSRNEQLQRIYGTAWPSESALQNHLKQIEEAEKRDHRKLGRELDWFHFEDFAPGSVFWHPKGWTVFQQLIGYMRQRRSESGYVEVNTPDVMDRQLWEISGHWLNYREHMYTTETPDGPIWLSNQ